ncbi:MAG: hypothetical protein ABW032_01320 [Burkholderiaceae bacterium]
MKNVFPAALAAALAIASSGAAAHAWATADIGAVNVSQMDSGPNFGITNWNVSLATGESISQTFSYRITLHTDGLPAARTWDDSTQFACLPLLLAKCGPDATGAEQVEVFLDTYRDGRQANPFVSFTGTFSDDVFLTSAGTDTFAGDFTLTATNTGFGFQGDGIGLLAAIWVDSNGPVPTIPEPDKLTLGLAGLCTALLALRGKRRAIAAVGH